MKVFFNFKSSISFISMTSMLIAGCVMGCFLVFSCAKAGEHQEGMPVDTNRGDLLNNKEYERVAGVSDQFYPADPEKLSATVHQFLNQASPIRDDGRLIALISPHAGHVYSGAIAGYGYKLLENSHIDTVILIGPCHRFPLEGASIWPKGVFKMPQGDIKINEEIAGRILQSSTCVKYEPQAHKNEHSLEVQLPFLQTVLKDFFIVPILVNHLSMNDLNQISLELASLLKKPGILLIASTDLSHYHPYKEAKTLDETTLKAIQSGDRVKLEEVLNNGKGEMCGEMPVLLLLEAVKRLQEYSPIIRLLKYANSGDTSGMKDKVVGYASLSITLSSQKSDIKQELMKRGEESLTEKGLLNEQEKKKLLRIARASITSYLVGKEMPPIEVTELNLLEHRGGFVTLNKKGRLRGCIGYIKPIIPLHKVVSECAISAAVRDTRFSPLQKEELEEIAIEISALTPLKKIEDINEIEVGEHGLYISRSPYSGLLLPQVATEYGWDRLTFLDQTCRKAGLPEGAWRKGADIYIFSAQVFGEKEK